MGVGRQYSLHEIDETRAAGREEAFEEILKKIKERGGVIEKDEEFPLYDQIGSQDFEIGLERVVEFNINKIDFHLTRMVEDKRISGSGHQKHLEDMSSPRIKISMKKKSQYEDTWQSVDLDEIF